ncbi:hypothetical protein [Qipengyuania atrilutea]|uniref:Uncharacterized protein n=1 Tax=Qipengyuania atrilutea TaxID=2744473 RepID=A0A850H766_9SPHN|nr:hypothetical protein [Actirhodobacter atriluteus]NVD45688.1 hypothetical protein [Actirhodobacter atriluteus]
MLSPLLVLGLSSIAYAQDGPTASLEELRAGDAMALADRLLPADARGDVVSGTLRREHHLPGQAFDAIYTGSVRPGDGQTCVRSEYRAELHDETADPNAERADPEARLPVTRTSRHEKIALAEPETGSTCAPATGFIHASGHYPDRQLYAMRTFAEMIGVAGAGGIAPAQVDCTADGELCDGVATLAALDIGQLAAVRVSSGRKRCDPAQGSVRTCYAEPVQEGEPFEIEATLSAGSGQMWKASWTAANGKPLALTLRKSLIPPF